jgi:hypothetical protein
MVYSAMPEPYRRFTRDEFEFVANFDPKAKEWLYALDQTEYNRARIDYERAVAIQNRLVEPYEGEDKSEAFGHGMMQGAAMLADPFYTGPDIVRRNGSTEYRVAFGSAVVANVTLVVIDGVTVVQSIRALPRAGRIIHTPNCPSPKAPIGRSGASNVNAADALRAKLAGLENAQKSAASARNLPDGRIRYYGPEKPAANQGPTRGASLVTEWDPKTGNVRQWMESYDYAGNVVRVHPKSINGQQVFSPHFPPTGKELGQ